MSSTEPSDYLNSLPTIYSTHSLPHLSSSQLMAILSFPMLRFTTDSITHAHISLQSIRNSYSFNPQRISRIQSLFHCYYSRLVTNSSYPAYCKIWFLRSLREKSWIHTIAYYVIHDGYSRPPLHLSGHFFISCSFSFCSSYNDFCCFLMCHM